MRDPRRLSETAPEDFETESGVAATRHQSSRCSAFEPILRLSDGSYKRVIKNETPALECPTLEGDPPKGVS